MLLNNSFHCLHHLPSLWHHQPKWSGLLRFDNLTLPRLYTIVVCVLKSGSDCVYFGLPLLSHQIRIESHEQIERRKAIFASFVTLNKLKMRIIYKVRKSLYLSVFEQTTWNSKTRFEFYYSNFKLDEIRVWWFVF